MMFSPDDLVRILKAMGEPTRLRALHLLSQGEFAVGELAVLLGQSQPGLSRHMKFLTDAGVVERHPEGAWVFYRLAGEGPLRALVDSMLSQLDTEAVDIRRDVERLKKIRRERKETAEAFWNSIAEEWDALRAMHYPADGIEAAIADLLDGRRYSKALDIGTGSGRMLEIISEHVDRLEGVDLSHSMLTVARANLDRSGISNALFRQGDAMALPYPDEAADLIIVHQVLHFLDDPEAALGEAARVITPGGRIILVDFAPHDLEFLRAERGHRYLGFPPETVLAWAERLGLSSAGPEVFDPPADLEHGLSVHVWAFDAQD